MVQTPEGLMPGLQVHLIEKGYALYRTNGHVYKVRANTKEIIEDFGAESAVSPSVQPKVQAKGQTAVSTGSSGRVPGGLLSVTYPSYVTWAQWDIPSTADPITNFNVSWTVPNAPTASDGQLIYLWNGLIDATGETVMQPVLQWGVGHDGGGPNWYVACWYVWSNGAAYTTPLIVAPGTPLTGDIQELGTSADGSYSYSLSFYNPATQTPYENGMITYQGYEYEGNAIPSVPEPVAAFITMEGYNGQGYDGGFGIPSATEYPAGQYGVVFHNILLDQINTGFPTMTWSPGTLSDFNGENTLDVSDNTQGQGQIQINFQGLSKPAIPLINDTSFVGFQGTGTQLCAITGTPGATVNVTVVATASPGFPPQLRHETAYTSTFTANTPGIVFSGGSSIISVTNSTTTQSFVMPASGYIVGTLVVTGGGTSEALVRVNYVSVSY